MAARLLLLVISHAALVLANSTVWCRAGAAGAFGLVAHHKTGTIISRDAHRVIAHDAPLAALCEGAADASPPLLLKIDRPAVAFARDGAVFDRATRRVHRVPCFAHFVRNPFQKVVSGYLYHRAGAEHWTEWALDRLSSKPGAGGQRRGAAPALGGASWDTQLFESARAVLWPTAGAAAEPRLPLPAARPGESYRAYLVRVDETEGLLAELSRARDEMDSMEAAHRRVVVSAATAAAASPPCESVSVCLGDVAWPRGGDAAAAAGWARVLGGARVPAAHAMRLAGALASACTLRGRSGNMTARGRGATHATSRGGAADTERARRVAEVVRLDGEHFGGGLLGLERALGCSRENDESGPSTARVPR